MFRGTRTTLASINPLELSEYDDSDEERCYTAGNFAKTCGRDEEPQHFGDENDGHMVLMDQTNSRFHRLDQSCIEKVLIFIDALQQLALLLSLSQPWPWPAPWLSGTRWVLMMNFDVVSFKSAATGTVNVRIVSSPFGEHKGYIILGGLYALIPLLLLALWCFKRRISSIINTFQLYASVSFSRGRRVGQRALATSSVNQHRADLSGVILTAAYLLYLPVILGVSRLLVCDNDHSLRVDPGVSCANGVFQTVSVFAVGVAVLFTLCLIHKLSEAVHTVAVHQHPGDFEKYLQRIEIEYALGLCTAWEDKHIWLVSGFRRHAVCYRIMMIYEKLSLVLVHTFLETFRSKQAGMFWAIVTTWMALSCARPLYRCRSSDRLHVVIQTTLCIDAFLGMLTASGVRSSILVSASQHRLLVGINMVGAVAAGAVVVSSIAAHRLAIWSSRCQYLEEGKGISSTTKASSDGRGIRDTSSSLIKCLVLSERWPSHETFFRLAKSPRNVLWIEASIRARNYRFTCETCPRGLEPIEALEAFMREVGEYWAEAKDEGGVLEPTLKAAMENLALGRACLTEACGASIGGIPSSLEAILLDGEVRDALRKRQQAQVLMTDLQRRVMLKLLAVSAFLNHHDLRERRDMDYHSSRDAKVQEINSQSTPRSSDTLRRTSLVVQVWKIALRKAKGEKHAVDVTINSEL